MMTVQKANGDPWLMGTEAYEIYRQCMYRPSPESYREEMSAMLGRADCSVYVCRDGNERVAVAALTGKPGGGAEILGIAVKAARQRGGIGSFLLLSAAQSLGAGWVYAETDGEAVGFYARMGFSVRAFTRRFADGCVTRYRCELNKNTAERTMG